MAELGLERHPVTVSHTELTAGHDVTQLLSQINQNFKQSKADQILRLLQDQDRTQVKSEDDTALLQEYDKIREEKVICDSDTLTDSSSVSDITECDVKDTDTVIEESTNIPINKVNNSGNANMDSKEYRSSRSRTSMGFYGEEGNEVNNAVVDTRDISIRPKSSYVRRRPLRTCFDIESPGTENVADDVQKQQQQQQRLSKSARPKSRHGRASVQRSERKIVMIEADSVSVEPTAPAREEPVRGNVNNTNTYDRFSSVRQAKRESKRVGRSFCDDYTDGQQTVEHMSVDSNNYMDTREEMTEVQSIVTSQVSALNKENEVANSVPTRTMSRVSSFANNGGHRSSNGPLQQQQQQQQQQQYSSQRRTVMNPRADHHPAYSNPATDTNFVRSDTIATNGPLRSSDRREKLTGSQLKRNNSNLGYRPRNPEPVSSRPIERPDLRPGTRTRRLQRRYMSQAQPHMTNVRPTSESVILARQRTEKNLLKKQTDNRPHSEKIPINAQNKGMLSVGENPTQGPQTYVTSKGGVSQSSHVQSSGFRGYDPGNRLKSGAQSRDFPSDLTLPRQGPNNAMMGSRKTLAAMMKLPPLEASLAAKKKERGLSLAQRETCV